MRLSHEESEDIAQDVMVSFIERGPGQYTTHAVIDAVRNLRGNTRGVQTRQKIERRAIRRGQIPILGGVRTSQISEYALLLEDIGKIIRNHDRQVFYMRHILDMNLDEIGRELGVSESRVCQKLIEIHERLRARL